MSWTQTLVAAVLTAALLFGGVVGLAAWAAPSWAGAFLRADHSWWSADRSRTSRRHAGAGRIHGSGHGHDICARIAGFDVAFIREYVAHELDLNASQKADFNALIVTFSQSAERLQDGACDVEKVQSPLPDRFARYAQLVDQASEEMHALTIPFNTFYRGLSDQQRATLDAEMTYRRGRQ